MAVNLSTLELVYCGDAWGHRTKTCGLTLIDQLFMSVGSVRANWSASVGISFIHTQPLSDDQYAELQHFDVKAIHSLPSVCQAYPMANKILPGRHSFGNKNILFLDCDTRIHKAVEFDDTQELCISYDALQWLPRDVFEMVFSEFSIPLPRGMFVSNPSFEYYFNDNKSLFPLWNGGVYYLRSDLRVRFYSNYLRNFMFLYKKYRTQEWSFYLEMLAFTLAIFQIHARVAIFPKGINFICTPRANDLKNWPADAIVLEHYAGDTSRPLQFKDNKIVAY